jgi:hypothetical protein
VKQRRQLLNWIGIYSVYECRKEECGTMTRTQAEQDSFKRVTMELRSEWREYFRFVKA